MAHSCPMNAPLLTLFPTIAELSGKGAKTHCAPAR
ncbi:hypothetical protein ACVWXL_009194 [Bradyrhizobium sp. GM22.5]